METFEEALELFKTNHFMYDLGVRVKEEGGAFTAEIEITDRHLNPYGMVHGGLLYALADSIVGLTVRSFGRRAVTLSGDFNYLSNVSGGKIIAKAETVRVGKTIAVMRAEVRSDEGKLLAVGTFTYCFTT